ncbi:MAG TPA: hypothetical protein VGU22_13940 [Methylomirabilota bacterium]|nr:hypothetical protein [Methylomirabilota bacterium]
MASRCAIGAVLGAILMAAPAAFAAEQIRVEARPGGVVGLDARGVERWSITHGTLTEYRKTPDKPIGPVALGSRAFYALGHEVLEVDPTEGRVIRRTRFPAEVVALAARTAEPQPAVLVTISAFGSGSPQRMTIAFRPDGPRPGRGVWGLHHNGSAIRDARSLVAGYNGGNATTLAPAARDAAIAAFERAETQDRTNPFLPAWRGRLLAAAGRPDEAARAFASAAALPAASWSDLLAVSSALEIDNAREAARRAFSRGFEAMREAGIRSERVHSLVAPLVFLQPPRDKLKQLADVGDVEHYDEVASRVAVAFPRAVPLDRASEAVAAWMRARSRADLAAKWTERAALARTSLYANFFGLVEKIDPMMPFWAGAWIAVLGLALVVGLRGGTDLRTHRQADLSGWRRWLPRPRVADLSALFVVLCAAFVLSTTVAGSFLRLGSYAAMPSALFEDGAAAPEVEDWLTRGWQRPSNPGRDRWLEYARQEGKATRDGDKYAGPPADDAAFREMAETVTTGERLRFAVTGDPANILALTSIPGTAALSGAPELGILRIVLAAVGLFLLGALVGALLPRTARFITWAVPGGPAPLSVAGGLVGGFTFAAILASRGFDRALRHIQEPLNFNLLGLPIEPVPLTAPIWAYVVLALCLVAHVGAVWLDAVPRRRI